MVKVRIFVEGEDDEKFITKLLSDLKKNNQLKISEETNNFNKYINVMHGKSKLLNYKHSKYEQVSEEIKAGAIEKVLFIFDCDFKENDKKCGGIDNSKRCFDSLIKELAWKVEIDVYIFEKNLDYFLLETINENECYEDFKSLIECLDIEKLKPNKKPIANLYKNLYPSPQFDFNHQNFNNIKQKLQNLFEGIY